MNTIWMCKNMLWRVGWCHRGLCKKMCGPNILLHIPYVTAPDMFLHPTFVYTSKHLAKVVSWQTLPGLSLKSLRSACP